MKEHYNTLNLTEGASKEEIQLSYDKLSKELDPANNDNQEFFIEEFEKVTKAYNALIGLSETSILKNSSGRSNSTISNDKTTPRSNSSGSFTVTISPEKIEELKNKAHQNKNKPHVSPNMFRNPFSFEGRIRRMEFGLSFIIYYFSNNILAALSAEQPVFLLILLPSFWFTWAQGAKRCHDRGNSGWYQLIPFYGFWLLFADGEIGTNKYGENPKGINQIL